jgi:hypothetical protein
VNLAPSGAFFYWGFQWFGVHFIFSVGAGLLAMAVNDNARELDKHGALESIASKPAPTGIALSAFRAKKLFYWGSINGHSANAR